MRLYCKPRNTDLVARITTGSSIDLERSKIWEVNWSFMMNYKRIQKLIDDLTRVWLRTKKRTRITDSAEAFLNLRDVHFDDSDMNAVEQIQRTVICKNKAKNWQCVEHSTNVESGKNIRRSHCPRLGSASRPENIWYHNSSLNISSDSWNGGHGTEWGQGRT
jgi:hypothetical protein